MLAPFFRDFSNSINLKLHNIFPFCKRENVTNINGNKKQCEWTTQILIYFSRFTYCSHIYHRFSDFKVIFILHLRDISFEKNISQLRDVFLILMMIHLNLNISMTSNEKRQTITRPVNKYQLIHIHFNRLILLVSMAEWIRRRLRDHP